MAYTSKIHIKARKITPTKKNILVTDMEFGQRTTSKGLILPGDDMEERGIRPRWARVLAVGPQQKDVQAGEWILIAHGRWTRGIDLTDPETGDSITVRLVDPKDVIMAADYQPEDGTVGESHSYKP